MRHGNRAWMVVGCAVAVAGAEWLRAPLPTWAWFATATALVGVAVTFRRGPTGFLPSVLFASLAILLIATQARLDRINNNWPAEREARIVAYGDRVGGELRRALATATSLAERSMRAASLPRAQAFAQLRRLVPDDGLEAGVAVLDSGGAPLAWAGRHRLAPEAEGDSIAARSSGYYVVLETRRHSRGRTVVASVLIWADPIVVDGERSLAERFRRSTEVGLLVYPAAATPAGNPDIFDYAEPTTAGPRLLFSVQPVPPEQDEARSHILNEGQRAVAVLLVLLLVALIHAVPPGTGRVLALPALLWISLRSDLRQILEIPASVWPHWQLPGPGQASGPIALGLAGILLGAALILVQDRTPSQRRTRTVLAIASAVTGVLVAWALGSTSAIPVEGASLGFWLFVLAAIAGAVLPFTLAAGGALAGNERPVAAGLGLIVMGAVALGVGEMLASWVPHAEWRVTVPLLLAAVAGAASLVTPRALSTVLLVATMSVAASLAVWQGDVRRRVDLAEADISTVAAAPDPPRSLLHALADSALAAPVTISAARLFSLYEHSSLAQQGYPIVLGVWNRQEGLRSRLALDSLSLSDDLLRSVALGLPDSVGAREIHDVAALPGAEQILAVRTAPGTVLLAATGPRSALVQRERLGRLLKGAPGVAPPYQLSLGSPSTVRPTAPWERDGSALRSSTSIAFASGYREVQATVRVLGVGGLLVRGTLLAGFSVLVSALLLVLLRSLEGHGPVVRGWLRTRRSFRLRLAVVLSAFFVLPTVAFAAWSFSHFGNEAQRSRDLLITQTLRDAVQVGADLLRMPGAPLDLALRGLSERVGADLALYRGGSLIATSAPILSDLGIVSPLMDATAFQAIALGGELEVTRSGLIPSVAERVGYRLVEYGNPGGVGILATPQAGTAWDAREQQRELAYLLLLTTLVGIGAAVAGANTASRALSRPVSDLRRAAIAVGQGRPTPLPSGTPPVEFEPVFGAFQRMAADVRASQHALDQARRRTATVLATVGTGVIAVDPDARVILANPRACELLGVPLAEGDNLQAILDGDLAELGSALLSVLADPSTALAEQEFTVGDRRLALQAAPLGLELNGVVLALNDVTDVSRAERVLAWGEMAQQVAHEIKNPLTPMRLGVQHLRRVYESRHEDFTGVLDETSTRILAEIDRLDTIARAFSRFAAPSADPASLETVDLGGVAEEVVRLYTLAEEGGVVELDRRTAGRALARKDEVKEVLVNLIENARNAGAHAIQVVAEGREICVRDDGEGIAPELLPRIFEPRFSTTTSGSGLGLAIVRRLVESWGGTIAVESESGRGTTVRVTAGEVPPP